MTSTIPLSQGSIKVNLFLAGQTFLLIEEIISKDKLKIYCWIYFLSLTTFEKEFFFALPLAVFCLPLTKLSSQTFHIKCRCRVSFSIMFCYKLSVFLWLAAKPGRRKRSFPTKLQNNVPEPEPGRKRGWMKKFPLYLNQTSTATKLIYFCCFCRWLAFARRLSLSDVRRSGDLQKKVLSAVGGERKKNCFELFISRALIAWQKLLLD